MSIELKRLGDLAPTEISEDKPGTRDDFGVSESRTTPRREAEHGDTDLIALVVRAQRGELHSQSELVRRYRARISGFIRPMLGSRELVEDLGQVIFIKMFRRLQNLRDPAVFESWLFTLARNAVLDHLRRARSRPVMVADDVALARHPDDSSGDRTAEIRESLAVATRHFDHRTRNLLEQIISGVSYGEIAARERVSIGAIKLRIHRVRVHLRESWPSRVV
jgi:RNA polymerase sigma-70 factor (ECF subfamily)